MSFFLLFFDLSGQLQPHGLVQHFSGLLMNHFEGSGNLMLQNLDINVGLSIGSYA